MPVVRLVPSGLALIATTWGLARYAYGLFLPQLRETFDLAPAALGAIGAGSYLGYCVAGVAALVLGARLGPRTMAAAAALLASVGTAAIAGAPDAWTLAAGVALAGASPGLASPAMAEAVASAIDSRKQDRSNALINSGTSIGVAVSGPVALVLAAQWRWAWASFAAVGLVTLAWALRTVPDWGVPARTRRAGTMRRYPVASAAARVTRMCRILVGPRSLVLYAAALGMGLASAAYWNFARELVVRAGALAPGYSVLFWALIGICGLTGGAAGDLIGRQGLARALRTSMATMAIAIGLLGAAPHVAAAAYVSAGAFGASYIMLSGIVLVWSVRVFERRPSVGLGTAFLLISCGQVAGSPLAGWLAGVTGLRPTFLIFAAIAAASTVLRPQAEDSARGSHAERSGTQIRHSSPEMSSFMA